MMMVNLIMLMFMCMLILLKNFNKILMMFYQNMFFIMFLIYLIKNNILFYSSKIFFMFHMDIYSFYLILLMMWIFGLMMMSFIKMNFMKIYIFNLIFMSMVLVLSFLSINYFMFYFYFELSMIPTLFLILGWGGQYERVEAGIYMLMYTLFASLPMMIILLKIYHQINMLNMILMTNLNLVNNLMMYLYLLLAFLVKMPIFFFHLWLPKAHVEAPISGSMILASLMLKLGSYGMLRVMLIMEKFCLKFNYLIVCFSLIGSFFISLLCLNQFDMKMLVAYSSVVHMGMLMGSLMTMNIWGYLGSLMMMIGHGLCSSGLFCLVNLNYERLKSRSLLLNKGMMNLYPSLTLSWFFMCIFNMSSPPSLNMFSEIIMINSLLMWSLLLLVLLMMMLFTNVMYMMFFYSSINHGIFYKNMNSFLFINKREYLLIYLHLIPLFYLIIFF